MLFSQKIISNIFLINIVYYLFYKLSAIKTISIIITSMPPKELLFFFCFFLFSLGILGTCVNRYNLFKLILSLELVYLSLSFFFIFIGLINYDVKGYIIALIIFSATAAETVVILALFIILFNFNKSIDSASLGNLF